jgi:hypothetical protein
MTQYPTPIGVYAVPRIVCQCGTDFLFVAAQRGREGTEHVMRHAVGAPDCPFTGTLIDVPLAYMTVSKHE